MSLQQSQSLQLFSVTSANYYWKVNLVLPLCYKKKKGMRDLKKSLFTQNKGKMYLGLKSIT